MKTITRHEARDLGLQWYFTGKPCSYGHVSERSVSTGSCRECRRIYQKNHRIKEAERKRAYRAKNKDKAAAAAKAYYETNREHILARYKMAYYIANRERLLAEMESGYEEKKKRYAEYDKAWLELNPGKKLP